MKFIHLSDLHIGKRVNEFSMLDDQEYILKQILDITDQQKPDGVIIAGDVYDKSVPSAEAVTLFDDFLVELSKRNLHVFVISGNHDSPERIAFGGRLMQASRIYMSPVYDGDIKPVTLEDKYGKINIWMLPFVKPAHVRKLYEDREIESYTDAMKTVIDNLCINTEERNIMITHQFVTGAERSESEEISVGGTDNIDVSVFDAFDYTALGHIHKPQNCKSERVRYSGTPLKYSFSEAKDEKSVTVAELSEKGKLTVTTVPLKPLHDMVELRGRYEELIARDFYKGTSYQEDYVHIILTDEEDILDAIGKLRIVYRNLMKLDYDNLRTRNQNVIDKAENVEKKAPDQHFCEFFEKQNNQPMSDIQKEIIKNLVSEIWEGEI
ncbi:MAG: exonuclease SbcCD subunit D [Ruminiclostridium sp.]|nr:exonuclease SbcCD subunit D [Ruminiclostridium sp.]